MQRVSALMPSWDRSRPKTSQGTHIKGKSSLDKAFAWTDGLKRAGSSAAERLSKGAAVTNSSSPAQVGRETYWPSSLDRECDKAARILKSFSTDGFLAQDESRSPRSSTTPSTPKLTTRKIPPRVIQDAVGLAIFSCVRSGLWMSGSGGSGILIARKADGTWSPPSGIILHTAGVGFVLGVDIYDCVLVINNLRILEMFSSPRVTLGTDVSLTVGPLSPSDAAQQSAADWLPLDGSVLTYLKARGKFQSVRLDGSLVTERGNENERFYRGNVNVLDILAGNVTKSIPEIRPLFEVIKAAEGRTDFDGPLLELLSRQPAPGDALIETPLASPKSPQSAFGIPDAEDPDPFGVIALEMAGLEIREAGSMLRPTSSQFEFNPSPTSPVFGFNRQSIDTHMSRSNRGSYMSNKTHATVMTDTGTQTDGANTPQTTVSPSLTDDGNEAADVAKNNNPVILEPEETEEIDLSHIDMTAVRHLTRRQSEAGDQAPPDLPAKEVAGMVDAGTEVDVMDDEHDADADDEDEDEDDEYAGEEEPVIVYEVATRAQPTRPAIMSSQVAQIIQAKGSLVTIPKRIPPPLPLRSPARVSRASKSEYGDVEGLKSPLRSSMVSADSSQPSDSAAPTMQAAADEAIAQPVNTVEHRNGDVTDPDSVYADHDQHSESAYHSLGSSVSIDKHTQALSTPMATEHPSSGEDSVREPQTPKVDEHIHQRSEKGEDGHIAVDIGRNHLGSAYIAA